MLLGDFDDVDKYLADARDLFSNLVALKKLESKFPYLTEEQVEAVKRFGTVSIRRSSAASRRSF